MNNSTNSLSSTSEVSLTHKAELYKESFWTCIVSSVIDNLMQNAKGSNFKVIYSINEVWNNYSEF